MAWRRTLTYVRFVLLSALLAPVGGCFGVSANPFHFGNLPAGDIVRTHAKPPLWGYYNNFDPAAATLTVDHVGPNVNQVRTQHVLIATVCDKEGNGRRNRRVEWHVTGVGHIVEVDEAGVFPGRGYMVDDHYAVSYTKYKPHTLTRGNDDPSDDVPLKPGQTYCVITSDEEGETHVTVHAPGIYDWEKHKVFVIKHWIDADAILPLNATNSVGTPHDLVTQVVRHSDKSPASGYRIRYQILDGPPAVLDAPGVPPGPIVDVAVDADGRGYARLRQLQPMVGVNRIKVDVIRPPTTATGRVFPISSGEMVKTWVAPNLTIEKRGPAVAAVGEQITYTINVGNTGSVPTSPVTIRDSLPETLQLIGTDPIVSPQGVNLIWRILPLQPGQAMQFKVVARATAPGTVTNVAEALADNLPPRSSAVVTRVVAGRLEVTKTGPPTANVGDPIHFRIKIANRGNGPALNIQVRDEHDPGLAPLNGVEPVFPAIPRLDPEQEQYLDMHLVARTPGRLCNNVFAKAANIAEPGVAQACVEVTRPELEITKRVLRASDLFVGGEAEFEIVVRNNGRLEVVGAEVQDQLPPELRFKAATQGGTAAPGGNVVKWSLAPMKPGQMVQMRFMATAVAPSPRVCNIASVVYGQFVQQSNEACIAIRGVPAFNVEVLPNRNPVIVGDTPTYIIKVINSGSVPLNVTRMECVIPAEMTYVNGISPNGQPPKVAPGGKTIDFIAPLTLPAGRAGLYEVQVKADRAGKARFKIRVLTTEMNPQLPFEQEQSTTIYDANDANSLPQSRSKGRPENGILSTPVRIVYDDPPASPQPKAAALPEPTAPIIGGDNLQGPALERPAVQPVSGKPAPKATGVGK